MRGARACCSPRAHRRTCGGRSISSRLMPRCGAAWARRRRSGRRRSSTSIARCYESGSGCLPEVSVIIPVYNGEAFLAETLESVRAQSLADWELIVVNDGSRDGTAAILDDYQWRLGTRMRVRTQANQGLAASRGHAVAMAQAPLVAFLDADDLWLPHKLERQVAAAEEHPDC